MPFDADQPRRTDAPPLIDVRALRTWFPDRGGGGRRWIKAVDGVSFTIDRGEALGLVGESGCGKTTIGRTVLGLLPATDGEVRLNGRPVPFGDRKAMRAVRRRMQIIFQDPAGSLNPRMRIGAAVGEPLLVHSVARGADLKRKVAELLERCGLWAGAADRYPHEFSGGQRQRIAIARALALEPDFIVCDEPTSALDVSVQAQILNLLRDLQQERGLAYLFISHDIAVVHHLCDRIAVMKDGRIVETGPSERIIREPQHHYTQTLLAAVPELEAGSAAAPIA